MRLQLDGLALPATVRPAVRMTDEELMRFSDENKPFKIERKSNGDLVIMTPVGGIGGTHELYVASRLQQWAEEDGRGEAFGPNTGFNLPDGSCLSPDAAWLDRARWLALSHAEQAGYPPLCPEFIVEVRSRSDSRKLTEVKMGLWIDNGAKLAWLIDPIANTVTIYRAGEETETLERPDIVLGHSPVDGFELRVARLWSE